MPTQLFSSNSRAPHHVAPMSGGLSGQGNGQDEEVDNEQTSSGNRLVYVGGDSKMSDTPWDASGKPKNMTK
jgi:hypothetical protein